MLAESSSVHLGKEFGAVGAEKPEAVGAQVSLPCDLWCRVYFKIPVRASSWWYLLGLGSRAADETRKCVVKGTSKGNSHGNNQCCCRSCQQVPPELCCGVWDGCLSFLGSCWKSMKTLAVLIVASVTVKSSVRKWNNWLMDLLVQKSLHSYSVLKGNFKKGVGWGGSVCILTLPCSVQYLHHEHLYTFWCWHSPCCALVQFLVLWDTLHFILMLLTFIAI